MTGPFDRRAQIFSLAVRPRSKGRRSAVREVAVAPAKVSVARFHGPWCTVSQRQPYRSEIV